MALTRRQFLKWAGATGIGAVVFNGCAAPDAAILVQSPLDIPEDLVTGRDNYYATTTESLGYATEGLLVRVMEGRAKKVEGNPDFPLNTGKHSARAEALLQSAYHPDRIREPLVRVGKGGPWRRESWDSAVTRFTDLMRGADPARTLFITSPTAGQMAAVLQGFAAGRGELHGFEPLSQAPLRAAVKNVFDADVLPTFDIAHARFILNFGADFLGTWLNPVHHARGYGEFRQGTDRRGYLVHIEPRMSLTASNADQWVYNNPGTEGLLALSIAYVLISERRAEAGAANALTGGRGADALSAYAPGAVAAATGVSAEMITKIAHAFAEPARGPALAIGGGIAGAHTNGVFNLTAIYALNQLVGNVNREGGVILNPVFAASRVTASPLRTWKQLVERMNDREIDLVVVRDANFVYGLPAALNAAQALRRVPTVVSFGSFLDETTALADLILPSTTPLEEWGAVVPEPAPGYAVVGFQQPVIRPYTGNISTGDVLLRVARDLNIAALPWETMRDAVRDLARQLQQGNRGSVVAPTLEEFWKRALERGGWWDMGQRLTGAPAPRPLPERADPEQVSDANQFPFALVPFETPGLGAGEGAHLPWLQSLPDAVSTITWQTWVELNPHTAERLGVRQEDVVLIESSTGHVIRAIVYVNRAAPPDVVAVPFGQGHAHYTSYAANRGSNVFDILEPAEERETGALAWGATRVRVTKTRSRQALSKLEGHWDSVQFADSPIIEITRQGQSNGNGTH
ncbi:MAG: twin-arginine translocation signal domain-containing protein [SAR202 cluster bacterium]|nr:twin-arginine translocation signal domain-containing protein [SAR202 cluster bacterium]